MVKNCLFNYFWGANKKLNAIAVELLIYIVDSQFNIKKTEIKFDVKYTHMVAQVQQ
jgi:hypothetical protein